MSKKQSGLLTSLPPARAYIIYVWVLLPVLFLPLKCKKQLKTRFSEKKTRKDFAMSRNGCNFASLFGSRGPRSELSGFFDALPKRRRGREARDH